MIVDDAVHKYRNGGCFVMAEALHRLTGYPVRCIDYGRCTHAFVLSPQNEVIDIHGRMPLDEFLAFLVEENLLPEGSVKAGLVAATAIPDPVPLLWLNLGYRVPSETAIKQAERVALQHPNLSELGLRRYHPLMRQKDVHTEESEDEPVMSLRRARP